MSVKVSNWAWHEAADPNGKKITGNPLILLLALADVADDSGYCRYASEGLTYDGLSEKTGVAKRTIIRLVAELIEQGLIDHSPGKKGRSNEFVVLAPWAVPFGDKLAPNPESDDADAVTDSQFAVTDDAPFGDNSRTRTSLIRNNVGNVTTSGKPETVGQRYAQPLCDVLSKHLAINGVKHSISKAWLDAARLMIDADGRDPFEAKSLVEWACQDSFWAPNIHSMPTFREKYDRLRMKRGTPSKQSPAARAESVIEMGQRLAQQGQKQVSA